MFLLFIGVWTAKDQIPEGQVDNVTNYATRECQNYNGRTEVNLEWIPGPEIPETMEQYLN